VILGGRTADDGPAACGGGDTPLLVRFPGTNGRFPPLRSSARDGAPSGRIGGLVSRLVDDVLVLLGITPPGGAEYAGGMERGDGGVIRLCIWLCFEPILCLEPWFGAE